MNCSGKMAVTGAFLAMLLLLPAGGVCGLPAVDAQAATGRNADSLQATAVQKTDTLKVTTEQKAKQKSDTLQVKKNKFLNAIKIDGGGNIDDVSNRGFVSSGMKFNKRIDFDFTFDYVGARNVSREFLQKEAKKKEKRLLIANVQYTVWRSMVCGLSYDSDGEIGLYSTLVKGGFKKQFPHGLYIDGFMGLKVGKIDISKEKEDVVGSSLTYKMPRSYTNNLIGFDVKASYRLPRKYATSGLFDGPWIGGFNTAVTFPVADHIRMGVDYDLRRDYIPAINLGLIRKAMSFKLSYEVAEDQKKAKAQ